MSWDVSGTADDFRAVARLAKIELASGAITIENLPAPHVPPTRLPAGKMAVYVFSKGADVLKVGRVGANSQPRYTYQHYKPGSALSTLAASILADGEHLAIGAVTAENVGSWIKQNIDRVNLLMDEQIGVATLALLEAFLHCRLKPRYEGFKSQRP